jgi:hypothetical protein
MIRETQRAREAYAAMPDTLELDVRRRDIALGVRGHPNRCALALAAQRDVLPLFPEGAIAAVYGGSLKVIADNYAYRWWIGNDGLKLGERFDAGKRVKPHKVQLYKPGTGPR